MKLQPMLLKVYNTTNVRVQCYEGSSVVPLHILFIMGNVETAIQYDSRVNSIASVLTMIITIPVLIHISILSYT